MSKTRARISTIGLLAMASAFAACTTAADSEQGGDDAGAGGRLGTGGAAEVAGGGGAAGATGAGGSTATGSGGESDGAGSGGGTGATGGAAGGGSGGSAAGGAGSGGRAGAGGRTGSGGGAGATGGAGGACPFAGHLTYTLTRDANPTAAAMDAYTRITAAMDAAVANYNCYANITKADTVTYNTSVATADGNVNGSIRFGPSTTYMTMPTAMHEIAHTVGIGSGPFDVLVVSGVFTGTNATNQLREITGVATDTVHGDTQHFWPYGLNYDSEYKSISDAINHCKMVTAIRKDMGMN